MTNVDEWIHKIAASKLLDHDSAIKMRDFILSIQLDMQIHMQEGFDFWKDCNFFEGKHKAGRGDKLD